MAEFSEKYSKIIKDIEKSISDEKEREIVLKKVSELSFMYMDVIDRISNVNSERMDDIEKHQDKLDEKIGKVKVRHKMSIFPRKAVNIKQTSM